MITTPLSNGHVFLGSTQSFDDADSAWCCLCGALVKSRYNAITPYACPGRIAAAATEEPPEPLTFTPFIEDRLDARAEGLRVLLEQARAKGIRDERARVTRIRNKAFAGKAVDDDMLRLIVDFDRLLASGEDDAA